MNLYLSLPPFSNKYVSDSAKNPATRLSLEMLFYIQKKNKEKDNDLQNIDGHS